MSQIDTIMYNSWDEFKSTIIVELYGDNPFNRGLYIFRGQASADWRLEPSFDRYFRALDKTERWEVYKELVGVFKKECEGMSIPGDVLEDNIKLTALGQHYGLPTRLLDWTDSPYVAAFFAFNDPATLIIENNSYVAIWALDTRLNSIWSSEAGVEIIEVPHIGNIRLRNQYGKFTLSKTHYNSLEEYVERSTKEDRGETTAPLKKFLIPVSECEKALADLDAMGINHSRVYPELTGCALAAKTRIFLKKELFKKL